MQDRQSITVNFGYVDKTAEACVRGVLLDHAKAISDVLQGLVNTGMLRKVEVTIQGEDFFTTYKEIKVSGPGTALIDELLGLPKGDLE